MSALLPRLSVAELSQRILEMATTGVYRESLFDTFKPMATKRQIREAIALAKQFGLRSDPTLRDPELGTYYQIERQRVKLQKVDSLRTTEAQSTCFETREGAIARILNIQQTMQTMLRVAGGVTVSLLVSGGVCAFEGQSTIATLLWSSALCACTIWGIQKQLLKRVQ